MLVELFSALSFGAGGKTKTTTLNSVEKAFHLLSVPGRKKKARTLNSVENVFHLRVLFLYNLRVNVTKTVFGSFFRCGGWGQGEEDYVRL